MNALTLKKFSLIVTGCLVSVALATTAIAQTAYYSVTFETTWTEVTHPTDYPPSPHFSGLVGGTHDATVSFWDTGELASLGMKRMAEWGSQTELLAEVQAAIDAGQASSTIADDPLWTVPGATSIQVPVEPEFPLVTLVAMIAPSPDWFVGVRNLDLRDGGQWADEIVIELFAYDAGTDSGPSYTSPDQATVPPEPIALIEGYPFTPGEPIGTFTFALSYVADVPEAASLAATVFPNPFNPQTTIAWELPQAGPLKLEIHDTRGRLVRRLVNEHAAAGPGRTVWNGQDETGRRASSGMYFVRVITDRAALTRKITLVQ